MDIKSAIQFIMTIEKIRSKEDLDKWCGDMGRNKLYLYIQHLAPEHWRRIKTPESTVRYNYEKILTGYKIYNK